MPSNCLHLLLSLTLNFLQGPPAYVSSRVKRDTPGYAPPGSFALINFILWPLFQFVWTSLWLIIMISIYHDFDPSYDFCSPSLPRSQGPSWPRLHFCQNRSQGDEFVFVVVGTEWYDKLGAVLSNDYYAFSLHLKELLQMSSLKSQQQANFKWGVRHRAGAQYGRR